MGTLRITGNASFLTRPYAGRTARLVDVSVVQGFDALYEIQLDPPQAYDPESLWVERNEFEVLS